jgi:hypothetical protein
MSKETAPAGDTPVDPDNIHADSTTETPAGNIHADGGTTTTTTAKPANIHADGTTL